MIHGWPRSMAKTLLCISIVVHPTSGRAADSDAEGRGLTGMGE